MGAVDGDKISTATEQDMEYDDTELSPVDKETLEHVQSTDIRAKSPVIKLGADKPILDRVKSPSEHGRVKSPSEHDRVKSPSEHGKVKSSSEHERVKSPSEHDRVKSPSEHGRVKSPSEQRLLDQDNESLSRGYLPGLVHE